MAASDQVQIGGQIGGQIDGQEQGLSGFRIQAVFCAITINLLDGFDVLAISFAAPSIPAQWALSPERLGLLFSVGLLGMVLASVFVAVSLTMWADAGQYLQASFWLLWV